MPNWKDTWAPTMKVPVMYSLVEDDPFFVSTEEEVDRCVGSFTDSLGMEPYPEGFLR